MIEIRRKMTETRMTVVAVTVAYCYKISKANKTSLGTLTCLRLSPINTKYTQAIPSCDIQRKMFTMSLKNVKNV